MHINVPLGNDSSILHKSLKIKIKFAKCYEKPIFFYALEKTN